MQCVWRALWKSVTSSYHRSLRCLEEDGLLDPSDSRHLFAAHYVFLPRLQDHLDSFAREWDDHALRTEKNLTPNQLWATERAQSTVSPPVCTQVHLKNKPKTNKNHHCVLKAGWKG